jgi:hypothetical protein
MSFSACASDFEMFTLSLTKPSGIDIINI